MNQQSPEPIDPPQEATRKVSAWLETHLGGRVVAIARQPRWRPVWFADVERDGERLALCVRGDRTDMPLIFPLEHEMRFQALLHDHGIPVARVHGWIDDPCAYVMDRVPGQSDFAKASDEERRAVVDDYLRILARLHALDLRPFIEAGIVRAPTPAESGVVGMARYERVYRSTKRHPEPFTEFCLGWLRRHPPQSRGREAPVVWDSGQFHHQRGRVVALLFATEALAEILDVELPTVEMPEPRDSPAGAAHEHLVGSLRRLATDDGFLRYQLRIAFRLARHLQRLDEIGDALADADFDDLHALLGSRPRSWLEGEALLERFVLADAGEGRHDEALLRVFHRRNLRAQMALGPAGSAMTRHLPIQPFGRAHAPRR